MQHQFRFVENCAQFVCVISLMLTCPVYASIEAVPSPAQTANSSYQLEQLLSAARLFNNQGIEHIDEVSAFYEHRQYRPAWRQGGALSVPATQLLDALDQAHRHALPTTGLHREAIELLRASAFEHELAKLDVLLTDAFMGYALRAGRGQILPGSIDDEWHYATPALDPVARLETALASGSMPDTLRSLLPEHDSYQRLLTALARYREIRQRGGWPQFAAGGPSLAYGVDTDELDILRARLRGSGDLAADSPDDPMFDFELEQAVKSYQRRHGLHPDGVVGPQTRLALSRSIDQRIEQIELNLERWRWLPRDLGERHIRVNTAGFELEVHDSGEIPLKMRVIVGKDERKTPAFTQDMRYLVFNPHWNVPGKIAREDIIPHALHDPGYFLRKRIRVLTGWDRQAQELDPYAIDWSQYRNTSYLPFKFRQDPGPKNSLGRIKFMLPNPFSVYLHDTPSRRLFKKSVRTFSSGCVRVEKPVELASYVMGERWTPSAISRIIKQKKNRVISLPAPIPVHMLYQTAWADADGRVHFRRDVYRRDARLLAAMPAMNNPIAYKVETTRLADSDPLSRGQN